MGKERVGLVALVIILSSWCVSSSSSSSSSFRGDLSRGKEPFAFGRPSSSLALHRVGSSIVFPLHGNVFPTGSYNTTLYIGQPPKPYFLDPDTGSDLTWLQCDAPCVRCTETPHPLYRPSNDLLHCKDPVCASLGEHNCDHTEQCDYEVEYADGGSSLGVVVKDSVSFESHSGRVPSPRVALGCGYDQIPGRSNPFLDGVLGLGKGKSSIVSQLSSQGLVLNVLGHCLSMRGGGFLFFGDDLYDSSRITWTPMSPDYPKYSPGNAELLFAGKATGLKNMMLVVDSGSSYTYFSSQPYQVLSSAVKKELKGKPLTEALDDPTLPLCWRGRKPFINIRDVGKYFKPFALRFSSGGRTKNQFEVLPESYLIISPKGNVCMGVLNGTQVGLQNMNVIGDISMQDKMIIYDNERQLMGWGSADCSRRPKSRAVAA